MIIIPLFLKLANHLKRQELYCVSEVTRSNVYNIPRVSFIETEIETTDQTETIE